MYQNSLNMSSSGTLILVWVLLQIRKVKTGQKVGEEDV